jgi:signal transduction histidine kinase
LIVLRDISALIKTEHLKSVEKLSEIMIASTSHDMRTPLNTIINMLLLISSRVHDGREISSDE